MSTSLASQLRRLAAPQTSLLQDSVKRPSILFDPKEAAEKDRQTIYEIGYQGLMELSTILPAFIQFEQTLFDRTTLTFERSMENKEVNRQLDKTIKRFFHQLSPYFMLKPTHFCLEWMIRRYHIHQFNKKEFLQLIFPYHETKMFVRCVQVMRFNKQDDSWEWLAAIQRPGVTLSRSAILNRAATDPAFLKFICKSTSDAVKELDTKANTLQAQFAFFTTSVVGALEYVNEIAEWHISAILECVLKGMSSKTVDFCAAAYMVTAQLVAKTQLATKVLDALISKISQVEHARLQRSALSLLVLIFQNQKDNVSTLSSKTLKDLTSHEWLPITVDTLAKQGAVVSCFCDPLISGCLQAIQRKEENWPAYKSFVDNFLYIVHLKGNEANHLIRCILDNYSNSKPQRQPVNNDAIIEIDSDDDELMVDVDVKGWYSEILKQLEQQYPEEFECVLKETMQGQGVVSAARRKALKTALSFRLKSLYSEDNVAVYENLYHYNTQNRAEAVKFLVKNFSKLNTVKDDAVLKDSLLDRLSDDEPIVLMEILQLSTVEMVNVLGTEAVVAKLIEILYKRKPLSSKWRKVTSKVLDHLLKQPLLRDENLNRIVLVIFSILIPIATEDLATAKQILSSELSSAVPSLKKLQAEVSDVNSPNEAAEIIERSLNSFSDVINIEDLLKAFTNTRDSIGFMILVNVAFKSDGNQELGKDTLIRLFDISLKHKLSPNSGNNKWYQNVKSNKMPLELFLNCVTVIAEKTKFDVSQDIAAKGVLVMIFEFLLTKAFSSKPDEGKADYTSTLSLVMNKVFPSREEILDFIANYFILDCTSESDERLETKIRAIRLFSIATVKVEKKGTLKTETFIKLVVGLCDPVDLVREFTLKALESLWLAKSLEGDFDHLAQSLLERHQEITLDGEQLPLILFTIIVSRTSNKNINQILDAFVNIIVRPQTNEVLKAKTLNVLKHINNANIFKKLLVTGLETLNYAENMGENVLLLDKARSSILRHIICKLDQSTVKLLNEDEKAWNFIKKVLQCHRIRSSYDVQPISIACSLLETFDEALYGKLSEKLKQEFIVEVNMAVTFADDNAFSSMANKLMKRLPLNAKHLEPILVQMISNCNLPSSSGKLKKGKRSSLSSGVLSSIEWKKGITLLEMLQNKQKIENFTALISPLIEILRVCLESEEQTSFEYAKQLVLSALFQCCEKLLTEKSALKNLRENVFRIDLVVQCIRASQNPQTHHHALMLLSKCAWLFPEQVLHNIMDIFTFMGSSIVRHDDAFSFQIITDIIDSIVPTLVNIESNRDKDEQVISIMRVFSDITLDVPEHRRLPLYSKLMRTLDATKYLWMFLCVLLEAHVVHDGKDKTEGSIQHRFSKIANDMPKRVEFALQLLKEFDVKNALETCIALFEYLKNLPVDKVDSKATPPNEIEKGVISLFNVSAYSAKQLRHFKYVLVQIVSNFTSSPEFINLIAAQDEETTKAMKPHYQEFIIKILCYVPQVTNAMEEHAGSNQLQYWKVMLHHCYDVLENAISLLSPDMLLIVVQGLMQHKLPTVRKKVIEILISKLQDQTDYFASCKDENLVNMLNPLIEIVDTILKKNTSTTNDVLYTQQSALIAIKFLSRVLSMKHVNLFKEVIEKLAKILKRHDSIPKIVLAAVVLAITEICSNLKAHSISLLSKFMPYVVEVLHGQSLILEEHVPDNVSIAIVTAVQKLFDTLPLFLGPYMVDVISSLVAIWVHLEKHQDDARATIIMNKLAAIWSKMSTVTPLRVLLPVFDKTYNKLIDEEEYLEIKYLMRLINESMANASSDDINYLQNEIATFYLTILDFRVQIREKTTPKTIDQVEDSILDSLTSLVLKLSESSFRPLYQKIYDWAMRKSEEKDRAITYFVLSSKIADALKSLYVLFASDVIKDAADLLDKCNSSKIENSLYFPDVPEKNVLLIENILKTLHKIFLYDSKEFINEHRFDILMQPIVDQLQNTLILENESLKELLRSCISELAHAVHSDILWKRLNYQILLKTRNNHPDIRIISIECCVEIGRRLGEQFVPLLPETVPFMAELFEDEVERVEKVCRRGVQDLEKVLGISLQEYF